MTTTAPARVRAMPRPRRQRTFSPNMNIDNTVVIGTPSWTTIEAADGLAVLKPMNSSAKLPAPISMATVMIRQVGRGAGHSQGRVQSATSANRTVA